MNVTKNRVYAILTAITLVAAYFLFSTLPPPKLEFRDRAFPRGFRDLVLESASSQIDPLFGLQRSPLVGAASEQGSQEVCDALFRDSNSPAVGKDRKSTRLNSSHL